MAGNRQITDNLLDNNTGLLYKGVGIPFIQDLSRVLFVSKLGNDAAGLPGRIDKPYLTIQGVLNAAPSGAWVKVFPGTYTEAITLPSSNNYGLPITLDIQGKVTITTPNAWTFSNEGVQYKLRIIGNVDSEILNTGSGSGGCFYDYGGVFTLYNIGRIESSREYCWHNSYGSDSIYNSTLICTGGDTMFSYHGFKDIIGCTLKSTVGKAFNCQYRAFRSMENCTIEAQTEAIYFSGGYVDDPPSINIKNNSIKSITGRGIYFNWAHNSKIYIYHNRIESFSTPIHAHGYTHEKNLGKADRYDIAFNILIGGVSATYSMVLASHPDVVAYDKFIVRNNIYNKSYQLFGVSLGEVNNLQLGDLF